MGEIGGGNGGPWLGSAFCYLSQHIGSGIGNVGSRRGAGPYPVAQTRGIGDNGLSIAGVLSAKGRGRKELWAGGQDIRHDSRMLRKPYENG